MFTTTYGSLTQEQQAMFGNSRAKYEMIRRKNPTLTTIEQLKEKYDELIGQITSATNKRARALSTAIDFLLVGSGRDRKLFTFTNVFDLAEQLILDVNKTLPADRQFDIETEAGYQVFQSKVDQWAGQCETPLEPKTPTFVIESIGQPMANKKEDADGSTAVKSLTNAPELGIHDSELYTATVQIRGSIIGSNAKVVLLLPCHTFTGNSAMEIAEKKAWHANLVNMLEGKMVQLNEYSKKGVYPAWDDSVTNADGSKGGFTNLMYVKNPAFRPVWSTLSANKATPETIAMKATLRTLVTPTNAPS